MLGAVMNDRRVKTPQHTRSVFSRQSPGDINLDLTRNHGKGTVLLLLYYCDFCAVYASFQD